MRMTNTPRQSGVTDQDVLELRDRAEARGDAQTVKMCNLALDHKYYAAFGMRCWCAQAIREGK